MALSALLAACAAPATSRPPSASPSGANAGPSPTGGVEAEPPVANAALPATPAAGNPTSPAGPGVAPVAPNAAPSPLGPSPTNERHGPPLPELSVKSFGLHVGGSKDAGARDDFLRTLEAASPRYLDCYRVVEQPGSAGTFGADLTIGGSGGHAKVKTTRTKLRGEAFTACMVRAFESVSFGRPPSGRAVTLSYSVKFSLTE